MDNNQNRSHFSKVWREKINTLPRRSVFSLYLQIKGMKYRVILSVLDPRKCEYLKDYSLDFEQACMTTYLAS